jgi:hypothetical protein
MHAAYGHDPTGEAGELRERDAIARQEAQYEASLAKPARPRKPRAPKPGKTPPTPETATPALPELDRQVEALIRAHTLGDILDAAWAADKRIHPTFGRGAE